MRSTSRHLEFSLRGQSEEFSSAARERQSVLCFVSRLVLLCWAAVETARGLTAPQQGT